MAEYQVYSDVRLEAIYFHRDSKVRISWKKEDWERSFSEPTYRPLYYVRCNITVI